MKRRLFTVLAAISLLLCVATAARWLYFAYRHSGRVGGLHVHGIHKLFLDDYHLHANVTLCGLSVPPFIVIIITAIVPSIWVLAKLRDFIPREADGLCCVCGYDLRATPERCPECGAVPVGRA